MIENIKVELVGKYALESLDIPPTIGLEAIVSGAKRWLGNMTNFRIVQPSTFYFDFEPVSEFGVQFCDDYRNKRVWFNGEFHTGTGTLGLDGRTIINGKIRLVVGGTMTSLELPTTACSLCPRKVPVMDSYRSKKDPNKIICDQCFEAGKASGTMKEGVDVATTSATAEIMQERTNALEEAREEATGADSGARN